MKCEFKINQSIAWLAGATSILLARGGGVSRLSGAGKSMRTIGVRLMEDGRILMRTKSKEVREQHLSFLTLSGRECCEKSWEKQRRDRERRVFRVFEER